MASGFIILKDGRCFARRWSCYDEIIRVVIVELELIEDGKELANWLKSQIISSQDDEDQDAGWGFYNSRINTWINRVLDLRSLAIKNQKLFWAAFYMAKENLNDEETMFLEVLEDLSVMYKLAEKGASPLEMSDWGNLADFCIKRNGGGWEKAKNTLSFFLKYGRFEELDWRMPKNELLQLLGESKDYMTVSKKNKRTCLFKYGMVEFYFQASNHLDGILFQPMTKVSNPLRFDLDYEWIDVDLTYGIVKEKLSENKIDFQELEGAYGDCFIDTSGGVRFYFLEEEEELDDWGLNKFGRFIES